MVKKTILLVLGGLIFLSGCTSVPHVDDMTPSEAGRYYVTIDKDYLKKPNEVKYAVNSFVVIQGGASYDFVRVGESNNFIVTIPGSQQVENLKQVRHFHLGRTLMAILIPTIAGGVSAWIFAYAVTTAP